MQKDNQVSIIKADNDQRPSIIALLQSEKLPADDLPATLGNFFVALYEGNVIGVIGMEPYGPYALLRSMIVSREHRNKNIAAALIKQLENHCELQQINTIYLLTETAPDYFFRKGYRKMTREEVPDAVKASSEFSHVCPVSAIVMKKELYKTNYN